MALRNGDHGYGVVTKFLHWVTVAAITGQFVVGYSMSEQKFDGPDKEICRATEDSEAAEAAEERCEERLEAREDSVEDLDMDDAFDAVMHRDLLQGGMSLPKLHVALGLLIIALGVARLLWRRTTPLPPWAEALSASERALESALEKVLVSLLFVVPGTGLLLVVGEDDWLPIHIAAHVVLYAVLALHVGLVLKHTVIQRDRHLARML